MEKVSRRSLVKGSAVAAATSSLAAPAVLKAAGKRFKWRLVAVVPKTLPVWGSGLTRFAKQVEEMSDRRLRIKVYGAGELVPALETFAAVKSGRVELGHSASYYWQGKIPCAPFFTAVPFGLNANGLRAWIHSGGGQALWDEAYKPHGVFSWLAGNTGLQMGGWFRKEINSLADFKGLKMRIPGLGSKVVAKAGAKPVLVAGGEIFTNLSTGVIDATEWVGPYHDFVMGFYKAAGYYYYPGWHEPGPALELMVNKAAYAKLPKDLQAILKAATAALDRDMYAEWLAKDAEYFGKIKRETKVKIQEFPKPVLEKLHQLSREVMLEVAKTSDLARRVHASYSKFQAEYEKHQAVTEWAYDRALRMG